MADFEIPTLNEFLAEAKNAWQETINSKKGSDPTNRLKLYFGTSDYDKFIQLCTENYNYTFTKGKKFAKEQVEGSISAIKVAIERLDESKKNHDKAMSYSSDKQEEELDNTERKVRQITKQKKVF